MVISGGHRVGRAVGVAVVALVAGVGTGCAQEYDGTDLVTAGPAEFAATPEYLGRVVAASTGQAFRYEMSMSMHVGAGGEGLDLDATMGTGAQFGDRSETRLDLGALLEEMIDEVGAGAATGMPFDTEDMVMETVGDDEVLYIRAPFFGEMPIGEVGASGPAAELYDALADLGDRWGRIDLTALENVTPGSVGSTVSGQSFDPMALFETLTESDEVEDLGSDEIDGVSVNGLGATVTFEDLFEAQGMDPDTFFDQISGQIGAEPGVAAEADPAIEALLASEMEIEVWVDEDGLARRLDFSMGDLLASLGEEMAGDDPVAAEVFENFEVGFGFEFFDYGDDSIEIEFPEDADTVDLTDEYSQVADELPED